MSFRRRLALSCGAAVAVVVVFGSALAYWIVSDTLHGQIDSSLRDQATIGGVTMAEPGPGPGDQLLTTATAPVYRQEVRISRTENLPDALSPDDPDLKAVASGEKPPFFADRTIRGEPWRVYITRGGPGLAVFLARPLSETYHALSTLRLALGMLALAGILLAVVLSRLATSFNTMLEALERSQRAQRQLVADASHELRTPLTSLRTNLEVLARGGPPDADDRDRLRADLVAQLEELSALVGDLVELARDEEPEAPAVEDVRLDRLVATAVERARRHAPAVTYTTKLEPALVQGVPARLDRAVTNLLDNAAKWSPAGSVIDVRLRDGELTVRDRGPGIEAADRDQVFDRFFRSDSARGRPGSGLGLAIVRQVAEGHGGTVAAEAADGGGALLRLRLPVLSANP